MLQQPKSLITIACVLSIASSSLGWGSESSPPLNLTPKETQQTIELLRACDTAVGACERKTALQTDLINRQASELGRQDTRLIELGKELETTRSRTILWFVAGMLVTGLTVRLVR